MYVLVPLLFNILFVTVINEAYTCFKEDKNITNALVHLRKNKGAGGQKKATAREPALVKPL